MVGIIRVNLFPADSQLLSVRVHRGGSTLHNVVKPARILFLRFLVSDL